MNVIFCPCEKRKTTGVLASFNLPTEVSCWFTILTFQIPESSKLTVIGEIARRHPKEGILIFCTQLIWQAIVVQYCTKCPHFGNKPVFFVNGKLMNEITVVGNTSEADKELAYEETRKNPSGLVSTRVGQLGLNLVQFSVV